MRGLIRRRAVVILFILLAPLVFVMTYLRGQSFPLCRFDRVIFERTPGWSGPYYKVTVTGDGDVSFYDFNRKAAQTEKLSEPQVAELRDLLNTSDFPSLIEKITQQRCLGSDTPEITTTVEVWGKVYKMVTDNTCPTPDRTKAHELEDHIDKIVNTEQWLDKRQKQGK